MNNQDIKRGVLYLRVSTEEQAEKGASLKAQENKLRTWAGKEGFEILKVYSDDGFSGKDLNRPGLSQLRKESRKREFDVVFCVHNDRLSRDTRDTLDLVEEFHKYGVRVRFDNLDMDFSTPEGEMFLTDMAKYSRYFRRDLGRKTKLGMGQKKKEGTHIGRLSDYFEKVEKFNEDGSIRKLTADNVRVKSEFEVMVQDVVESWVDGESLRSLGRRYEIHYRNIQRIISTYFWLSGGES